MAYTVKNIRAKIPSAVRERHLDTLESAINSAKATSEFFHGVYAVSKDNAAVCYFVDGRRFLREDTALARA